MQKAGEAISGAMSSNAKISEMKPDYRWVTSKDHLTSDTGVRQPSHDIWLSASTGDRKGPQLLEDNYGREKASNFQAESSVAQLTRIYRS